MYFKNEKMEIMFYLLEMDGKMRMNKLKINTTHFSNSKKAVAWYNNLKEVLNSDEEYKQETERALNKLEELYLQMLSN